MNVSTSVNNILGSAEYQPTILLYHANSLFMDSLEKSLKSFNYEVVRAEDIPTLKAKVIENKYDLVLFRYFTTDGSDSILNTIKAIENNKPCIVLSGHDNNLAIQSLELGADIALNSAQYDPRVINAYIKKLLKYYSNYVFIGNRESSIELNGYTLDVPDRCLAYKDSAAGIDETIALVPMELEILRHLFTWGKNGDKMLPKKQLMQLLKISNSRSLDVQICTLRKKLKCARISIVNTKENLVTGLRLKFKQ